jgi:hypothetical protein
MSYYLVMPGTSMRLTGRDGKPVIADDKDGIDKLLDYYVGIVGVGFDVEPISADEYRQKYIALINDHHKTPEQVTDGMT